MHPSAAQTAAGLQQLHHPSHPQQQSSHQQQQAAAAAAAAAAAYHHHQFGPLPQTTYDSTPAATTANNYNLQQQQHHQQQHHQQQQQQQQQQREYSYNESHQQQHQYQAHHHQQQQHQQREHQQQQQREQHPQQQQQQRNNNSGNNSNQPSIRWTSNGESATAERRLPFVHRFRPVNSGNLAAHSTSPNNGQHSTADRNNSGNVLINPYHHNSHHNNHQGQQQHHHHHHNPHHHRHHSQHNYQQHQALRQQKQQEKLARNMAQYDTNPIGALQERFQSRGIIPDYKFLNTDGASHCPTFTFQVSVGDITAQGSGQTKKQAKQAAARAMLDILDGRAPSNGAAADGEKAAADGEKAGGDTKDGEGKDGKEGEKAETNGKAAPGPAVGNEIGLLQEYCVTNGLPMPVYDVINVGGQPHQRIFVIAAKVGCLSVNGEGTSKKESKREAATKMHDRLKALGTAALPLINGTAGKLEPGSYPGGAGDSGNGSPLDPELVKMVNEMKIETLTSKNTKQIQQFYGDLSAAKNGALYALHRNSVAGMGPNFVKFLNDLATEQKFSVTFVEVDEPAENGAVQSLVQLSSMPVAVCNGFGANVEAANNDAAKTALLYLKMMTKKKMMAAGGPGQDQAAAAEKQAQPAQQQQGDNRRKEK